MPIFKSGDAGDYKNYRPISLLPALSKIFEKLMLCRLNTFLSKHHILHESQHGFCTKHSTCTAITDVLDTVTHGMDNKLLTLGVFVDVAKAFDSINHEILLAKLEHYGIRGLVNAWFRSYLTNCFQYTELHTQCSLTRLITAGVPQGSILGPLLYLMWGN